MYLRKQFKKLFRKFIILLFLRRYNFLHYLDFSSKNTHFSRHEDIKLISNSSSTGIFKKFRNYYKINNPIIIPYPNHRMALHFSLRITLSKFCSKAISKRRSHALPLAIGKNDVKYGSEEGREGDSCVFISNKVSSRILAGQFYLTYWKKMEF